MSNREAVAKYRTTEKGKASAAIRSKRYRERHPDKCKENLQRWRALNPNKVIASQHKRMCTRHGITLERRNSILESQNYVCALCLLPEQDNNKFVIDHDHNCCPKSFSCGKCIRGIIHSKCNKAIGFLEDKEKLAIMAYEYLVNTRKGKNMSSFRQTQTEINDAKCLEDALKQLGYKPSVSAEKQAVRGHYNESRKAEIVLKKEDLKEGGDVGFSKDAKGNFSIVTDTYVMRNGFNLEKFTKDVKQKYAEVKIRKQASAAGLTFLKKVDNGNGGFKLQFVKA